MSGDSQVDGPSPGAAHAAPEPWEEFFSDYMPSIREFLCGEHNLRAWEPPVSWFNLGSRAEDEMNHARSLHMLRLLGQSEGDYYPDMLLYALGNLEMLDSDFARRLSDFVSGESHLYLCNASGTGKTRLVFETLAHHWGIYFTCAFNVYSDPYGSRDLQSALSTVQLGNVNGQMLRHTVRLSGKGSRDAPITIAANRAYADCVLRRVFLARLLVLDHYYALVRQLGLSDEVARRNWLLLQLRPSEIAFADIFDHLIIVVHNIPDDQVAQKLHDLYHKHRSRIKFVAIDEAQVALHLFHCREAFAYNDGRRYAAMLREIVVAVGNHMPDSRVIISGVELNLDMAVDAIESSRSRHRTLRFFHDLGAFHSQERIKQYLAHFFGQDVAAKQSALVHTWMRGRHRLITALVMCTLMTGTSLLETVLDTLVFKLTGYQRSETPVLGMINIGTAIEDQQLEDFRHAHLLRLSLLSFARQEQSVFHLQYAPEFIRLGVALFDAPGPTAALFEPFAFLTLCRWLQSSARYSWHGLIEQRLTNEVSPVDDSQFLEAVATSVFEMSALWDLPSRHYLSFLGAEPPWVDDSARLALPRIRGRHPKFAAFASENAFSLVETASTSEDVFTWFSSAEKPFLVPDPAFGASMLCFLSPSNSENVVLLCFHSLPANRSRRMQTISPCDPSDFYRSAPQTAKRLKSLLRSLPNLSTALPSGAGSRPRPRVRPARFSVVRVLCFAHISDPRRKYDPLVASLDFSQLWSAYDPHAVEIDFSHVTSVI